MTNDRIEKAILRSAELIADAEALLITAGAGMGVDSGLPDFRSKEGLWRAYPALEERGLSFGDLAQPHWFGEEPDMAWAFYGHRQQIYTKTTPHRGYELLRDWGRAMPERYFVFTSNVDGQFQRASFDERRLVERHGNALNYQCSVPCTRQIWMNNPFDMNLDLKVLKASHEIPHCPECGAIARPNVLMFFDDTWVEDIVRAQQTAYADWLNEVTGARVVIIECGAGTAVPTVRRESERIADRLGATLIRINPTDSDGPEGTVPVPFSALEALKRIERALPREFRRRCAALLPVPTERKPMPANHIRKMKSDKLHGRAWQLELVGGGKAWLEDLDVAQVYRGYVEGLPGRYELHNAIEDAKAFVRVHWNCREAVVLPPKIFDPSSHFPMLPGLRFAARIDANRALRAHEDGSRITLIWFAEVDDEKSLQDFVKEALAQLEWADEATGYKTVVEEGSDEVYEVTVR